MERIFRRETERRFHYHLNIDQPHKRMLISNAYHFAGDKKRQQESKQGRITHLCWMEGTNSLPSKGVDRPSLKQREIRDT